MPNFRMMSVSNISIKILDFPEKRVNMSSKKSLCQYNATLRKTGISKTQNSSYKKKNIDLNKNCPAPVALGMQKPFNGNCPKTKSITNKFSLIEDSPKSLCLRNPNALSVKLQSAYIEQRRVKEMLKNSENVENSSESRSTISNICVAIDLANPLNLDFQGMDYKNTYTHDEQSFQNQMEYRKVRRYKHRRNALEFAIDNTEKSQQEERVAFPKHFDVEDVMSTEIVPVSERKSMQANEFGKLVRVEDKPEIWQRLKKESCSRKDRYKILYLLKKEKKSQMGENVELQTKENIVKATKILIEKEIADLMKFLGRTFTTKKVWPRIIPEKRDFPHNLKKAVQFRKVLKLSKRIFQDRAKIMHEFYKQMDKPKRYNYDDLEISSDSSSLSSLRDVYSTDNEDEMEVGRQGRKFLLRGYLYKMGMNLRGKFPQKCFNEKERKVKSCITREEWFETLVPKKRDIERTEKSATETHLFPFALCLDEINPKSGITEFIKKPLERYLDQQMQKKVRIKKKKQIKVRKFNLINYLYGIKSRKEANGSLNRIDKCDSLYQTLEYIRKKKKIEEIKRYVQKRRRMGVLGILYPSENHERAKSVCVDSISDNSDWIPDNTYPCYTGEHPNLRSRGNMPAPDNRESTLRCNPRRPRNYTGLRIPSAIFDKTIKISKVPVMRKLKDDRYFVENVSKIKKTDFAKKFEARHHHDHWDPTQHKYVHVAYARRVIKPKQIELGEQNKVTPFDNSRSSKKIVNERENYAFPKLNTVKLIQNFNHTSNAEIREKLQLQSSPQVQDLIYHSIDKETLLEFPARNDFIDFLTKIKMTLSKCANAFSTKFVINKTEYINELKQDIKSVSSCLSSLSSSVCTNLTNESGSFLLADDKEISLDYIRKALVPFEEMNRSRFEAVLIDTATNEEDPFRTVPFSGQKNEQTITAACNDNYFTFNTRLQNGKRHRLEVKRKSRETQQLGTQKCFKGVSQVSTDIDELYINDLKNQPSLKSFKWNSFRTIIKNALLKKFESGVIQGEIVRTKIFERRNENYFQQMLNIKALLERLFSKREKKEYEATMEVVYKVKPYYETTDKYRRDLQELVEQCALLNMEVVYIENDWTARTILQNFHYLLADMEWRIKHDWIHRMDDGELEGFEESISKRKTKNIRQRDKDDAWAIKQFYDNVYLQQYHPIKIIFNNTREFVNGFENLKSKTFISLRELHYTLWIFDELNKKYKDFRDWCSAQFEIKKTSADNKCIKKHYMEERISDLRKQAHFYLRKPIDKSFNDNRICLITGVCKELYKEVAFPPSQIDVGPLIQISIVSQVLDDLTGKFEVINHGTRLHVEKRYRRLMNYRRNISRQAVFIERRIASEMVRVQCNISLPFQKSKRTDKILRSALEKPKIVHPSKTVSVLENSTISSRAFYESKELERLKKRRESFDIGTGTQDSMVPFYFDYFLSVNGYQPNYNFKTQIELRDGLEIERFQIRSLLPKVLEKFEKWLVTKQKIMDEHINKNSNMYHNVQA